MGDQALLELAGYVLGAFLGSIGIGATTFLIALSFPAVRAAFVERLHQRALRQADASEVAGQLAGLRGEVYALRCELAQVARGIPADSDDRNGTFSAARPDRALKNP